MTADRDLACAFLRADPLRHLMNVKYLCLYPDGVARRDFSVISVSAQPFMESRKKASAASSR